VQLEGLGQLKNPMTSSGIKPTNVYAQLKSKETSQALKYTNMQHKGTKLVGLKRSLL
jgi:hypothetical protein